jgi:hypothetical protein
MQALRGTVTIYSRHHEAHIGRSNTCPSSFFVGGACFHAAGPGGLWLAGNSPWQGHGLALAAWVLVGWPLHAGWSALGSQQPGAGWTMTHRAAMALSGWGSRWASSSHGLAAVAPLLLCVVVEDRTEKIWGPEKRSSGRGSLDLSPPSITSLENLSWWPELVEAHARVGGRRTVSGKKNRSIERIEGSGGRRGE